MKENDFPLLNIMIVGKGGQGIVLASNLLIQAFINRKMLGKKSEIHGMAQRGGSVVSHVRIGKTVHSPLIPEKECHYLLAMENQEGKRWQPQLLPNGTLITLSKEKEIQVGNFKNIAILALFFQHFNTNPLIKPTFFKPFSVNEILKPLKDKLTLELYQKNQAIFSMFYEF